MTRREDDDESPISWAGLQYDTVRLRIFGARYPCMFILIWLGLALHIVGRFSLHV